MLVEVAGFIAGAVAGDAIVGRIRPTTMDGTENGLRFFASLCAGILPTAVIVFAHQVGLIDSGVELSNVAISFPPGYYTGGLLRILRDNPGTATAFLKAIIGQQPPR